jgi:fatty-acyl-CoA synthase
MGRDTLRRHRVEGRHDRNARGTDGVLQSTARRFKAPRKFVFEPIPKTATGKVQKFQLRAELRVMDRS